MRFSRPNPAVIARASLSGPAAEAATTVWTIQFDVPAHPGMPHGAHLFTVYSGMDVRVGRAVDPDTLRVVASGTGADLCRLLDWCNDLYRGWDVDLRTAFAGEEFIQGGRPRPGVGLD